MTCLFNQAHVVTRLSAALTTVHALDVHDQRGQAGVQRSLLPRSRRFCPYLGGEWVREGVDRRLLSPNARQSFISFHVRA